MKVNQLQKHENHMGLVAKFKKKNNKKTKTTCKMKYQMD